MLYKLFLSSYAPQAKPINLCSLIYALQATQFKLCSSTFINVYSFSTPCVSYHISFQTTKTMSESDMLQLQAEIESERDNFKRQINDLTAQNSFLYLQNIKGVTAKTSLIEISPSNLAINSIAVNILILNVKANIKEEK